MKKVFLKAKFYWHLLNCSYLGNAIQDCLCKEYRCKLQQKIHYHEQSAMSYVVKS